LNTPKLKKSEKLFNDFFMKVVATIPAYNEEKSIGAVISEVKKYVDQVVVVDDGSADKTFRAAAGAGADVLKHPINRGQGAALKTGIDYALNQGAEVIVHFDADGQQEPAEIRPMVSHLLNNNFDIVIGSRFLDKKPQNIPLIRKTGLKLAILVEWFHSGLKLSDAHNGFRAMTRQAAQKIQLTFDGDSHASEIIGELARNKLNYAEFPVTVKYTKDSLNKDYHKSDPVKALIILKDIFFKKLFS